MNLVSAEKDEARNWLAYWWPRRRKAQKLAQDYAAAMEEYPNVFADLARFCCAFTTTTGETDSVTMVNNGKREAWLHVAAMSNLEPDDLVHLQEETENG